MTPTRRSNSLNAVAILVVTALVGSARPAAAATISWLETNVSINTGCDPNVPGACLSADDPVDIEIWGPNTDPAGISQGFGLLNVAEVYGSAGEQFTVSGASDAHFGNLQVRLATEYDLTALADPGYRYAFAGAQSFEQLTHTALPTGTPGFLDVTTTLSGEVVTTGSARAAVGATIEWDTPGSDDGENQLVFFSSQDGTVIRTRIPFVYGEYFNFSLNLTVGAGTIGPCLPPPASCDFGVLFTPQNDQGFGSADFFNTLTITGMVPLDQFGNPVLGGQFLSASGTRYTVNGVEAEAVPEPGTMLLLGTGLAAGIRRWKRRNV